MKKLPIGLQTFSKLIEGDYYYADKTPLIAKLVESGQYYFLSRPRRFGKSLLISTLKSAFAGEEKLFKDLYLEKNWDWSKQYAVIPISFGRGVVSSVKVLNQTLSSILNEVAQSYGVCLTEDTEANRFAELIRALRNLTGLPVVILIDEYDKPILDNIDKEELALTIRDALKNIYSVIKDSDAYIKFALLTGVSKFSKISLFSGLNNLEDISLNPDYATLCGYTEPEIKQVFGEYAANTDFELLRQWYNGYNFLGEKVYNPFDVLLYFKNRQFKNYWFETGNPSFLLKLIRKNQYNLPKIENIVLNEAQLGSFDIGELNLESVLFQTGYLTIKKVEEFSGNFFYYLTYPNREVKASLNQYLLADLTHADFSQATQNQMQIYKALESSDLTALKQTLCAIFASIPHDWYRKNQMSLYEGYYASIVYSCFCALGFTVIAEDSTNHGRIDLTVMMQDKVFIIEFKVLDENSKQGTALTQIKAKNYQQKYLNADKTIFLIGIEFEKNERNIVLFEWEQVES
ncbi:MAG: AAA family ATPase [Methylococcaceae bacterium]|nr:AAA family ATPase [Methylococcaceae bacterium]